MTLFGFRLGLVTVLLASLLARGQADPLPRVEIGATVLHGEDTSREPGVVFGGSLALARWAPLSWLALEPRVGVCLSRQNASLTLGNDLGSASYAIDSLDMPLLVRAELLLGDRGFHVVSGVFGSRLVRLQQVDEDGTRRGVSADTSFGLATPLAEYRWDPMRLYESMS